MEIRISSERLVGRLLELSRDEPVCLLDSCGADVPGPNRLIAGLRPRETHEISDPARALRLLDRAARDGQAAIFTISYDLGLKLQNIEKRPKEIGTGPEPLVFISFFDTLIFHEYGSGRTYLEGDESSFGELAELLAGPTLVSPPDPGPCVEIASSLSRSGYLSRIERIQEYIRAGDTYQTNLTQRFEAAVPARATPQSVFATLRRDHPAPYAAFISRPADHVVSISPERFFTVPAVGVETDPRPIRVSPIKGTRPRGRTPEEDRRLRQELEKSIKDRAENTMIVDLLRNDLGRVCRYGSVRVEKLCDLEVHPSIFHLVSTVAGELRPATRFSDIVRALFPCGSITGCPKIRTMQIIDELETVDRGLSMGAIGWSGFDGSLDLSVAIRTLVIRGGRAFFNVGGGIVIDSVPAVEYEESLVKARALFRALGVESTVVRNKLLAGGV